MFTYFDMPVGLRIRWAANNGFFPNNEVPLKPREHFGLPFRSRAQRAHKARSSSCGSREQTRETKPSPVAKPTGEGIDYEI